MRIEAVSKEGVVLALSADELYILKNALNEVCNGLDIEEFETRMGAKLGEVLWLLDQLHGVYRQQFESEP